MNLNVPKPGGGGGGGWNPLAGSKPALKQGRSLMDWIRFSKGGKFMTGYNGRRMEVTEEELAKHNTVDDAWMALGGMVYNVTSYMEFHPGGIPELERGMGTDATQLFDEVHRWVNFQSMLAPCLIGKLIEDPKKHKLKGSSEKLPKPKPPPTFLAPSGSTPSLKSAQSPPPTAKVKPRYEWFQNEGTVSVSIYTRWKELREEHVIIDIDNGTRVSVSVNVEDYTYIISIRLTDKVEDYVKVNATRPSGVAEVIFRKVNPGVHWADLGKPLDRHTTWKKTTECPIEFRKCELVSVDPINHDTKLFYLRYPPGTTMHVPVGYHVHLEANVEGMEITRSYTVIPPDLGRDLSEEKSVMGAGVYLMIKIYPDGAMTQKLEILSIGGMIDVSNYEGTFSLTKLGGITDLVLLAAGTGVTPMISILQHVLYTEPQHEVNIQFIFFNKQERDILWKEKFDSLVEKHSNMKCRYVLSQPNIQWQGPKGRIRRDLLDDFIAVPSSNCKPLLCACGPTDFTKEAIRLGKEMGYSESQMHAFLA